MPTDPKNEASDTPRTDLEACVGLHDKSGEFYVSKNVVSADFSRTLERECKALREECERLKNWNMDRAGQFACTEQRISTDNAKLRAELAEASAELKRRDYIATNP